MYIAMNRFRVNAGREEGFEQMWRTRDSYLDQVPGFREFHLLRGDTIDGITTYLSHSIWESRRAFIAWTESEAFRKAHGDARSPQGTLAGHPVFEGYEVIL
ncbi:MAG TPA: antibiotic biosynthesis monooxygenase [Thermoanaerobaculia bacterium]|jgi:heme-degrading monooxygenase HmoA|nr:antibiotic biosynthesis monooxygenase [Thermoanaerobaculia bacterium]